jgi:DNA replication protein DnaC
LSVGKNLYLGADGQDQWSTIEETQSREQRRLILGGMGGIGKTQLAIAYAKRHCGSYESIFWLNAVSEFALKTSLRSMAEG